MFFKDCLDVDTCILCENRWQARRLLRYAFSKGFDWMSKERSFLEDDMWDKFPNSTTVYYIGEQLMGSLSYAKLYGHKIIEFKDIYELNKIDIDW